MSGWRPFEPSSKADDNEGRDSVSLHLGDSTWHDGPGWYYTIDDYPDEGSCGAFATREEAVGHAECCGYAVTP